MPDMLRCRLFARLRHAKPPGEAWWTERARLTINRRSLKLRRWLHGNAQVAQLVEHATENRSVGGSIPPLGTITSTEMSVARFSELTTHKALSKAVNGDFRMPLVVVAGRRILHSSEAQLLDAVADRNRFR